MMNLLPMLALVILNPPESQSEHYDKYGGWKELKLNSTGFFRVEEVDGIWWMVDPEGHAFISKGVNHVSWTADYAPTLGYSPYERNVKEKYGDMEKWIENTIKRLRSWKFNTIGAWSNSELFNRDMPYTIILDIGASAGASWIEGSFIDVFSKQFAESAERRAEAICSRVADDPFLIGYFTDNELRWGIDWRSNRTLFDDFLALPRDADGKKALVNMIRELYLNVEDLNDALQINLSSFNDLLDVTEITQLGEHLKLARSEPTYKYRTDLIIPKELIILCLNQFYGSIENVNKAFGTNVSSFDELLTCEFMTKFTTEIVKRNIPKEIVVAGLEMAYGNIEKLNEAFGTNAKTYEEFMNQILLIQGLSPIAKEINRLQSAFLKMVAEKYFKVCRDAIRKFDKNHLILGCRFAGYAPVEVLEAMKVYVDVVSFNNYSPTPPVDRLNEIHKITGKPVMITEFSFKAMDSGLPNTKGAGVPVETQKDRADRFEAYVKGLMELPFIVGYHWFEYADEPAEGRFDGENSNYGLVNIKDEPWEILVNRMAQVNAKVEALHRK